MVTRVGGVRRERLLGDKTRIAFDRQAQRTTKRGDLGEAHVAEFRHAESEVAESKRAIRCERIDLAE